ncbi:MAG: substrate-binding domain-containing protein [Candidatus Bathyarchaeia archaeon]
MKPRTVVAILVLVAVAATVGAAVPPFLAASNPKVLTVATTTSTVDTGLLDHLNSAFTEKHDIPVRVLSVGTGQALEYGKRGDVDMVLVHARPLEEAFVNDGFGVHRVGIMYNDFIILGPRGDPADLHDATSVADAFNRIAEAGAEGRTFFVSRGDKSGTHMKELSIWNTAHITSQGQRWYVEAGGGMGSTLLVADDKEAYTLSDRGTFASYGAQLDIGIVFEGGVDLLNPYGAILVNPELHPDAQYDLAVAYVAFLVSDDGQKLISDFEKNGQHLFIPIAQDYSAAERLGFPSQREEVSFYLSRAGEIEAMKLG